MLLIISKSSVQSFLHRQAKTVFVYGAAFAIRTIRVEPLHIKSEIEKGGEIMAVSEYRYIRARRKQTMRTVYYSLGSVRNLRIEQKNKALKARKRNRIDPNRGAPFRLIYRSAMSVNSA